jgi:chorismate synthase
VTQVQLCTAGESHGPQLTAVLTGVPSGITLSRGFIDAVACATA